MANNIPSQTRTVDPYSSYDSNIVNQLTRMITRETDCIDHIHSIDVIADPIEQLRHFYVSAGQCYKDDVIVQITDAFRVDMQDPDFYTVFAGETIVNPLDEVGYYHILLHYEYVKAKPAPQAKIYIIKPSQRSKYTPSNYIFLKAVYVDFTAPSTFYITDFYDADPTVGYEDYKRTYSQVFCGVEDTLPTFSQTTDQGRIIYVVDEDNIYFGGKNDWLSLDVLKISIDVFGCTLGQLVYVGSDSAAHAANATDPLTFADGFVSTSADPITGIGQIKVYGYATGIPIQSDVVDMAAGDSIYLSNSESGTITNVETSPYSQYIGKCLSVSTGVATILFQPGKASSGGGGGAADFEFISYQQLLSESIFKRLFVESFSNLTFVDPTSTVVINTVTRRALGDTGDELLSNQLGIGTISETYISKAQISANSSDNTQFTWYLSNDDGTTWEETELDSVHTFATVAIPYILASGSFTVGEWVQSSITNKRGIVCADTGTELFLSDVTGTSDWQIGEVITGDDSLVTCVINASSIDRTTITNTLLKARAVFNGDSLYIEDYCVLYDLDTEKDETSVANEMNINTLYGDMYEVPSQNNDGLRLYPFSDTTSVVFLNVVHDTDTIVKAITRLDHSLGIGQLADQDSTPSLSDHYRTYTVNGVTGIYDITDLTDAYNGEEVNVINLGANAVTFKNSATMHLASAGDQALGQYDSISLIYVNSTVGWVEKTQSNN